MEWKDTVAVLCIAEEKKESRPPWKAAENLLARVYYTRQQVRGIRSTPIMARRDKLLADYNNASRRHFISSSTWAGLLRSQPFRFSPPRGTWCMATFARLLFTTNGGPVCNWRTCPFLKMSSYCRIAAFMKTIAKDELYENLSQFLKGKGVDLKEGQYTKGIHAGCSMLADAINLSQ